MNAFSFSSNETRERVIDCQVCRFPVVVERVINTDFIAYYTLDATTPVDNPEPMLVITMKDGKSFYIHDGVEDVLEELEKELGVPEEQSLFPSYSYLVERSREK